MKFLLKLFKGPIKSIIIRELKRDSTKELLVDIINDKLDIPKLDEEEEAKFIRAVLDALIEAVSLALERL